MPSYTQLEIDRLLACEKSVKEPPAREFHVEYGQRRKDAVLVSEGDNGAFHVFIRINDDFPENFSVGLRYSPGDDRGEITLLRCNGKHGDFNRSFRPDHPHSYFHVHRATQEAIDRGIRPESIASITDEYASCEEAVAFFVRSINLNVVDAEKHFSQRRQGLLFNPEGKE